MKWISFSLGYLLFWLPEARAQTGSFSYQRPLRGAAEQWHKIELPNEIFGKISPALSDIRILGITAEQDTVEVPYLLQQVSAKTSTQAVAFTIINTTHRQQSYYYTLALAAPAPINRLYLNVAQENFDWRITLEGSQDQQEWFTIVEDYRILSVKNALTDYRFTTVTFPSAQYRYYRLRIDSGEEPSLNAVKVLLQQTTPGKYRDYTIVSSETQENKQTKQTVVDLALEQPVPVSFLKIYVEDTLDYYRSLTVQYVADSFDTPKGWKYRYQTLASGTLSSLEDQTFAFDNTILQKIRVLIDNQDNPPLTLDRPEVKGYVYTLTARFGQPATYFLAYGNSQARKPEYDLVRFADKIPDEIASLEIGAEQRQEVALSVAPFSVNQGWLWATLMVVIGLLGWFSLKMMRAS